MRLLWDSYVRRPSLLSVGVSQGVAPLLGVIILNYCWRSNGVIATQPVVETVLVLLCIFMYRKDIKVESY